jgi:hypothetical protein
MTVDTRQRRHSRILLLLVLLLCPALDARAAGEYRTVEVEGLKITIDSEWASRTAPGYVPVRFDITNLTEARVIEIIGQGSRFFRPTTGRGGGEVGGLDLLQAVRLARGDRVRFTIPVPVAGDSENMRFEIRENGTTVERFNYTGFQSRAAIADASALIVADPNGAFGSAAAGWKRTISRGTSYLTTPGGGPRPTIPSLDFVLEPARLPSNWLGFTSLRAVLIGTAEWDQLDDGQRSALLTWTACGGDLIVVGGNLQTLVPGVRETPGASDLAVRAYYFGRVHVPTFHALATGGGLTTALSNADKVRDANWALPVNAAIDWGTTAAGGFRLPIPGVSGVPARTYLTILIVFSIVIGPVNYWFLWRRKQQALLVLTAPLISAIFIVLLGGYVIAGEGFGVRGRAVTFTMLDQVRRQAVMRASVSLYAAGMTPGGGLRFPRDMAVFPISSRDRHALDLTEAQRFSSGVIQARSPTNLEQVGFRSARERLGLTLEAGGVAVVNGLDSTISALVYRIGNRDYSLTEPLAAGARGVLRADGPGAARMVPTDVPLSGRFAHLFGHQPEGSYLAVLERSPFWDPGLSRVEERHSFHVVIGWPGGQP